MIPFKRVIFASAVAPLTIAVPLLALGAGSWVLIDPERDGDAPLHLIGAAVFGAAPLYLLLVAACTAVALIFKQFGRLSRRSLLLFSSGISVLISTLMSRPWVTQGEPLASLQAFLLFLAITALPACALTVSWWWLASNPSIERTVKGLRPSPATHVQR